MEKHNLILVTRDRKMKTLENLEGRIPPKGESIDIGDIGDKQFNERRYKVKKVVRLIDYEKEKFESRYNVTAVQTWSDNFLNYGVPLRD